ncbi:MAG TPA: TadE/TadG family type IV pilus assembly protein [Rhizomicrobium sp.]|nr:TadE/TadG family type IV pilus assembly protein [Rhizomicrobium sp.]
MRKAAGTKRVLGLVGKIAKARSGSAIIEFALIAPVFFLLIFSIMEIGIIFFAQSTLQVGANDVARLVRTGQVQGQSMTQAAIRTRVCADIAPLIPCDSNLMIDVESFSNFGGVGFSNPLDGTGQMKTMNAFSTGNACDVVLVRVFYAWTVFTPVLTPFLTNMANNKHLLYSAASFRNEPFSTGMSGC